MILIFRGKLTSRWFGKTGIVLKSTWDLNVTQIANGVPLRARVRPKLRTNFGVQVMDRLTFRLWEKVRSQFFSSVRLRCSFYRIYRYVF